MNKPTRIIYVWEDNWYDIDLGDLDEMNQWINDKKKGLNTKPPRSMVEIDHTPSANQGF